MSHTTNESEDGFLSKDHDKLTLIDEVNCEGSGSGAVLKKGPWTSAEDAILVDYVKQHGEGNWNAVQKHSGLYRCGKSCRLRWANHLRPNLKKGAITQEEEKVIIELHAKMGNKWARMAAHLPGRTDNEIKNYWNTRIKRRHRAGLPLYPPEICLQSQQGQNICGFQSGDKEPHDFLQTDSCEIAEVVFKSLISDQTLLPYITELPDISASGMLTKSLGSPQYYSFVSPTAHRPKRLRESPALFPGYAGSLKNGFPPLDHFKDGACDRAQLFGLSFPLDLGPTSKNPLSYDVIQGSHSLSNGNFSASKPTPEAVKLELPSLQYTGIWGVCSSPPPLLESLDTFIQSPLPNETVHSDYLSSHNSGLLDALLLESKTLSSLKNHVSDKSSNSSTVTPGDIADSSTMNICETELEDYGDPISPLGHSATSLFSGNGSSLDEQLPAQTFSGCTVKSELLTWTPDGEKETGSQFDIITWSDSLLSPNWFEQSLGYVKEQAMMTDAIATILGEDSDNEYKHIPVETFSLGHG